MSKRKKHISLVQKGGQPAPPARTTAPPADDLPVAREDVVISSGDDQQTAARDEATAQQAGIESQPLFWFVLGGLAVGIIVLLGLLLLTSSPASSAASPAQPAAAIRPTNTAQAAAAPQAAPNVQATLTAYTREAQSVPRISIEEAKRKSDAGQALVVDVRIKDSYAYQHIKGAVNIPESDTEARLSEFPKDKDIILYCS